MIEQKVLILDIETAPMTAYIWQLKEQFIGVNQIKSDWYVLAWSAKWLDDPASKVMYYDQRNAKKLEDDRRILQPLWKLLDEADIVITQNGERFDGPKLNARFILHGMNPPKPYRHLDTYKIVKRVAGFTSNTLEYLTSKLCVKYKKESHKKFVGMSLWVACLAGNKSAWEEMKWYNTHDVLSTEELYIKIRAWAPSTMATPYHVSNLELECPICGVTGKMTSRGFLIYKTGKAPRFQCQNCGAWRHGTIIKQIVKKGIGGR